MTTAPPGTAPADPTDGEAGSADPRSADPAPRVRLHRATERRRAGHLGGRRTGEGAGWTR